MLCQTEAIRLMRPVEVTRAFMSCHSSSIRELLQDEFALLQSDFTREVFCYSGSLPTIDLTIGYLLSDKPTARRYDDADLLQ